ncbi:hypothetical protein BDR22DRAFT_895091 [Usnea florida]
MFASSLWVASSLLFATTLADSSPYSKFINDANSLLAAATGADGASLEALYSWQATQTAVPSDDVNSQYQDYLNSFMTTTSAPLPAWVTAVPSSLQPAATSFLQAEASLVVQDIAPLVSQNDAAYSTYSVGQAATTTTSVNNTAASTPASSGSASTGFVKGAANMTTSQVSATRTAQTLSTNGSAIVPSTPITTATGSPTPSPTPSVTTPATFHPGSGAEKPASRALAAAVVAFIGVVVLL